MIVEDWPYADGPLADGPRWSASSGAPWTIANHNARVDTGVNVLNTDWETDGINWTKPWNVTFRIRVPAGHATGFDLTFQAGDSGLGGEMVVFGGVGQHFKVGLTDVVGGATSLFDSGVVAANGDFDLSWIYDGTNISIALNGVIFGTFAAGDTTLIGSTHFHMESDSGGVTVLYPRITFQWA